MGFLEVFQFLKDLENFISDLNVLTTFKRVAHVYKLILRSFELSKIGFLKHI